MNNCYLCRFEGKDLSQFPWDRDNAFQEIDFSIFRRVEENILMKKAILVPELREAYLETLLECAASAAEPPPDGEPEGRGAPRRLDGAGNRAGVPAGPCCGLAGHAEALLEPAV